MLGVVLRYGVPLSLTVALAVVIGTTDRFLIAWFLGEGAAGLYSVSVDLTSRTLTLLLMVINTAMFPIAVRAWEDHGPDAAREQMRTNASLLMGVGIPAVAGLSVLAGSVAHCFLGASFRTTASQIVPLVALGSFLAGFKAYHWDAAFQFVHRTIYQVWIVLFVAVVNLGLNVLAIPRFGINGAAGASVVAYAISIGVTIWFGAGSSRSRSHCSRFFRSASPPRRWLPSSTRCGVTAAASRLRSRWLPEAWSTAQGSLLSTSWDCASESFASWRSPGRHLHPCLKLRPRRC